MGDTVQRPGVEYTLEAFAQAEYNTWDAFVKYQKARDDFEILKDTKKDYLAGIMTDISNQTTEKLSESSLERMARSSEKWKKYNKGFHESVREYGNHSVRYFSRVRMWETIQSGLSYKKKEIERLFKKALLNINMKYYGFK